MPGLAQTDSRRGSAKVLALLVRNHPARAHTLTATGNEGREDDIIMHKLNRTLLLATALATNLSLLGVSCSDATPPDGTGGSDPGTGGRAAGGTNPGTGGRATGGSEPGTGGNEPCLDCTGGQGGLGGFGGFGGLGGLGGLGGDEN